MTDETLLIFSHKYEAWWAPDERGYTKDLDRAGRYGRADAERIVGRSCAAWMYGLVEARYDAPPTVAIVDPEGDFMVALERVAQATAQARRLRDLLWGVTPSA